MWPSHGSAAGLCTATHRILLSDAEGATDAASCRVVDMWPSHGSVAGMPAGFGLEAIDAQGNRRKTGGDVFKASLEGACIDALTAPE